MLVAGATLLPLMLPQPAPLCTSVLWALSGNSNRLVASVNSRLREPARQVTVLPARMVTGVKRALMPSSLTDPTAVTTTSSALEEILRELFALMANTQLTALHASIAQSASSVRPALRPLTVNLATSQLLERLLAL